MFIFVLRDTEREAKTQAEGEAGSCGEPNVGLDPRTPGPQPEPKADTQPLSHLGAPDYFILEGEKMRERA